MCDEQKPKIENLELNKETLQELTEGESEQVQGGAFAVPTVEDSMACHSQIPPSACCSK